MRKRGLSGVITSLILIVLVLAAVGIIWVVVKNTLAEGTEEITLTRSIVDLEIQSVVDKGNTLEVEVKRDAGEGDISGLMFVVSDGVSTKTIKEENVDLDELEKKRYVLDYPSFVKKIFVAPIFTTESGKEKQGSEVGKIVYTTTEALENIGMVAWWKMDGEVKNEIGVKEGVFNNNASQGDGIDVGPTGITSNGKYGKAYDFDGDWINT